MSAASDTRERARHTWDPGEIAAHDRLIEGMRILRESGFRYYVNEARILDADPLRVAPRDWTLSKGRSTKAIQRDRVRVIAYEPVSYESARAYLVQRHCCGVAFDDEPMGFGPFPHGWIWLRLDDGVQSWGAQFHGRWNSLKGHKAILGPNVVQDGAKMHSSTDAGVPFRAADRLILDRRWVDQLAADLGAYRAWDGGDDDWGRPLNKHAAQGTKGRLHP